MQPATNWIDIERDYGCRSIDEDPNFDNAPLLNQCFADAGRKHFAPIYIPGKAYRIDDTVYIPARSGISVVGTGITHWLVTKQPQMGPASVLVWYGRPGKAMVEYQGLGLHWQGVSLFGRPKTPDGVPNQRQRASCGILIRENPGGLGTGKLHAPTLSISECKTGIQFGPYVDQKVDGNAIGDRINNADNCLFGFLYLQGCEVGMLSVCKQSVSISVGHLKPYYCDTAIYFRRGGKFRCYSVDQASPGVLLRLGKVGSSGIFQFFGVTIDNNAARQGDGFALLEMDQLAPASVTFQGVHFPHSYPSGYERPIAILKGNARLTLRDCYELSGRILGESKNVLWGQGESRRRVMLNPSVVLDNCRFTRADAVNVTGARLVQKDCYDVFGNPLADQSASRANREDR